MTEPTNDTSATDTRKHRKWPWLIGIPIVIVAIFAIFGNGNHGASPTPASTAPPTVPVTAPAVPAPAVAPAPAPTTPAPVGTVSQRNAVDKAESYLDYSSFSRSGLIKQLEFEGFTKADATYGVDHVTVDWREQADKKAKSYMDYSSFSRSSLIKQLEFEGFTKAQAEHGASSVGL